MNVNVGPNPDLKSGHPALEFTNTVPNHASAQPGETLFNYKDMLNWTEKVSLLRADQVQLVGRKAARQAKEAAKVYTRSLELREAIYRIFVAQTKGEAPVSADLAILNSIVSRLTRGAYVVRRSDKFEWQWSFDENALEAPLYMIALSAVDLMTSENYQRVGQCADQEGCGWLFVDTSKNHSRRWCDINDCGNRAKQRRYQQRARKQKSLD